MTKKKESSLTQAEVLRLAEKFKESFIGKTLEQAFKESGLMEFLYVTSIDGKTVDDFAEELLDQESDVVINVNQTDITLDVKVTNGTISEARVCD